MNPPMSERGVARPAPVVASTAIAQHPNPWVRALLILVRGILMLLLVVVYELLQYVVLAIALLQYLALLLMGQPFASLRRFNEALAAYMGDLVGYLTCVDDPAPFPFSRLRGARERPLAVGWRARANAADTRRPG